MMMEHQATTQHSTPNISESRLHRQANSRRTPEDPLPSATTSTQKIRQRATLQHRLAAHARRTVGLGWSLPRD
jgi:hypothetical protein